MSFIMDLPPDVETRLEAEASRQGVPASAVALRLIERGMESQAAGGAKDMIARDGKGRAYLAGKTMRVVQIAIDAGAGETPEQIAAHYPHISLAQVCAALAYYYANRAEVDAEIAAADAFAQASMQDYVPHITRADLEERRAAQGKAA